MDAEALWHAYLDTLNEDSETTRLVWRADTFGDTPALADELAELVIEGRKRGTAPCVAEIELAGDALPAVGDHLVVLDGRGRARCVVRTTRVALHPFDQVPAAFAEREGEGDGSLEYWRREHWPYYERMLAPHGLAPTSDLPVVCEEFELVFVPDDDCGSL